RAPPREMLTVTFSPTDCRPCPARALCTHTSRRTITLHPREHEEALRAARAREQTDDFAAAYAQRAGVEGTHAQVLRVCSVRRSPLLGPAKTPPPAHPQRVRPNSAPHRGLAHRVAARPAPPVVVCSPHDPSRLTPGLWRNSPPVSILSSDSEKGSSGQSTQIV